MAVSLNYDIRKIIQPSVDAILRAEAQAMAVDGPVTPTSEVMTKQELEDALRAIWRVHLRLAHITPT